MPLTASRASALLLRAAEGSPLDRGEILDLYCSEQVPLSQLAEAAREVRRRGAGEVITYSPKVFLPLTNLCRDRCGYCTFRRDPGDAGAHWMEPEEVLEVARAGERLGCREALLSLGDRPEAAFPEARHWLSRHGFSSTLQYVAFISELLLRETTLFPHSNPGLMAAADLARLKESNASLGLMLETTSTALFAPGAAHDGAVDKLPSRRLRTIREAGERRIPFTTGILVGIGESAGDVVDSLVAIRDLEQRYGHVQEVIVQNFVPKPEIPMRNWIAPDPKAFARVVAIARLALGPQVGVQAPPNLSPDHLEMLLDCGLNDWGGISPLTRDYINPEKPWPQVEALAELAERKGLRLRERLTVYPRFVSQREFFSAEVWDKVQECADQRGYPWAWPAGNAVAEHAAESTVYGH